MAIAVCLTMFCGVRARAEDPGALQKAVERILAGKGTAKGEAACDVFRSGVLTAVFGVDTAAVTLRPGSKYVPHFLCMASWEQPNRGRQEVSLTILDRHFESAAEAVADLEGTVAQLSKGVTVEVHGTKHTTQVDFEGWIDGVGDKAAWAPRLSELQVACSGVRYAVSARGFADAAENKAKAIELARRVAAVL